MQKSHLNVIQERTQKKFTKNAKGDIDVLLDDGSVISAEKVFIALGRPPLVAP